MKRTKTQKGITLVALILTIVVLMILAVVSINAIQNTEIISHATDAANRFNQAQKDENTMLGQYNSYFEGKIPGTGSGNGGAGGVEVTEGDTVELDSDGDGNEEEWIVLTATEGLVEIVSADSMGSLTLGYNDSSVNVTTDLDGDGEIGNDADKAIASYNNAITTINDYCKSLVKEELRSKVRSVGGTNNSFTPYSSTNYDNWGSKITVDVASSDEYYKTDLERMQELGIAFTGEEYWMASRNAYENFDEFENLGDIYFHVRLVNVDGEHSGDFLWSVASYSEIGGIGEVSYISYPVRLVITNPTGFQAKK